MEDETFYTALKCLALIIVGCIAVLMFCFAVSGIQALIEGRFA